MSRSASPSRTTTSGTACGRSAAQRGHFYYQGLRFFIVAWCALAANLLVLEALVRLGLDPIAAQAIAIIVVTPVNFVGNKLWSFRHRH